MERVTSIAGGAFVQQAKSPSPDRAIFTNCGKVERAKRLEKTGQKKLKRVPFAVSRLAEFCALKELINQTGHHSDDWPSVVFKELVDNALDACEEAEIAPVVSVIVIGGRMTIQDNGPGIPAEVIQRAMDYSIRVSTREAYCSPTRGAQGNALKTIFPMSFVLDDRGDEASSETIIEVQGVAHHIAFGVDHIKGEPTIAHTTRPSPVTCGTRITVEFPLSFAKARTRFSFYDMAIAYVVTNPHLSLRLIVDESELLDVKGCNPDWRKWLPSWPTSPHWYDRSRLRRYMAAHIANRGEITVREFISEFRGLSSTAKQKKILRELGLSHVSLHDFFGRSRANGENIATLLETLKRHSKPVHASQLGLIGKDHLFHWLDQLGAEPKAMNYMKKFSEMNGGPAVIEIAFGAKRNGLDHDRRSPPRTLITGINWSPGIGNPFRRIGKYGESLESILSAARAGPYEPVVVAVHVAASCVSFTDRGKSAIVIEGDGYVDEE